MRRPLQVAPRAPRPPSGGVDLVLLSAAAIAVLLRVWCVLDLRTDVRIRVPLLDAKTYLEQATALAAGHGWAAEPFFMNPLYPTLLGGLFALTGPSPLAVHVAQALLGLGTFWLLYLAADRFAGRSAARMAAFLAALCGPWLAMEAQALGESLMVFLVTAALACWPDATRPRPSARGVGFGLACGALAVGRGTFLLLPLVAWVWTAWRAGSSSRPLVRTEALAGGIALALVLLPVAIHQTRTTGGLRLFTVNSGLNLYVGNNPSARGGYAAPSEIDLEQDPTARRSASIIAGRELSLVESDRLWRDRAWSFLRESPARAFRNELHKLALFLRADEAPQIDHFGLLARDHWPLRVAFVGFGWLLPLSIAGWILAARSERRDLQPCLVVIAVGLASALVFFATGRYRLPILPAFWILAGFGLHTVSRMAHEATERRRLASALGIAFVIAVGQWLLPGPDARASEAFDRFQVGVRLAQLGRTEEALVAYRRATELTPNDPEPWNNLGATLVKLGRLPEALTAYERAVELQPRATSLYNLGIVQARLGRDDLALTTLERAARTDPLDPRIQSDLGVALARAGRMDEAVARWKEALRLRPDFAPALNALRSVSPRS